MTDILDTVPNRTRIRVAAGASLSVQVTLKLPDGTLMDVTGGTVTSEIAARTGSSTAPSTTEFETSLVEEDSVVSMSLTFEETAEMQGTWAYRVWLDLTGPTRMLVDYGDLEVVAV